MRKLLFALLLVCAGSSVRADQFSLFAENDFVYNEDAYFTHGTRFQYLWDDDYGVALGQNMYTPQDLDTKELIPNDRPYAGWLYLSDFHTTYYTNSELFVEAQIGVTGHDSFADDTQTWVHEHIGSRIPQGWGNQIPNHIGALVLSRYTWYGYSSSWYAVDPYICTAVGNMNDYAGAGFLSYLGYNLPAKRNTQRTIPFKLFRNDNSWRPYAYVYGGVEPRYTPYNLLLRDSHFTIHQETFIFDRNAGVVFGCKYFELAVTLCYRSKEFSEQEYPERYGSAKLSFNF